MTGKQEKKLKAQEIMSLYDDYAQGFVDYLKGSFVIVVYLERENKLLCVADRLNVLPVYYAYKNDVFILSSSIKAILDSGLISTEKNTLGIVEFALFDYNLGAHTCYKDIIMMDHGEYLTVDRNGIQRTRYFCIDSLFQKKLMKRQEAIDELIERMRVNVSLYLSDSSRFLVSLTGGFDGRANLAMIDRNKHQFLCYSYGKRGSMQILIPEMIADTMKLSYQPVFLDEEYEKDYETCALQALYYSDGTAPIIRANYPYAYKILRNFSPVALTGLFGSEVLRPLRNRGIQINDNSECLFVGNDFDQSLARIVADEKKRGDFRPELFDKCYDELRHYLWERFFAPYDKINKLVRFYIFFIGEGVRKYFMQELRIERMYIDTRFPYFDFDFVNLVYRTPFAGIYNGALKHSPLGRRNAQSLYAHLIKRLRPELGDIVTDRGYCPNDLLSPLWFMKIAPKYMRMQKRYRKTGKDDAFDSERWSDIIFSKQRELMKCETDIFTGKLFDRYCRGENYTDNYRFSRLFSLKYWFEKC